VQHALRAYTPNDQKDLRAAARSFRVNPAFDTEEALQELGTGEALVSVLDGKGIPSIVERAGVLPPRSSMSAADDQVVQAVIRESALYTKYTDTDDRRSAYEVLAEYREEQELQAAAEAREAQWQKEEAERLAAWEREEKAKAKKRAAAAKKTQSTLEKAVNKTINSTANTIGREIGKQIIRGLFGTRKR